MSIPCVRVAAHSRIYCTAVFCEINFTNPIDFLSLVFVDPANLESLKIYKG